MTVRFHNGARAEALILAGHRNQALVVVEGRPEAEEWRIIDGRWCDQTGQPVEIEALFALDGVDCAELCAELSPRTATAGGRWVGRHLTPPSRGFTSGDQRIQNDGMDMRRILERQMTLFALVAGGPVQMCRAAK